MKYPPEIRHTCGILHHVLRQAAMVPGVPEGFQSMIDVDILRTDDRIRSRFLNLTRSRFGRDLEEGSPDLTSIAACARRLQVIPQIQSTALSAGSSSGGSRRRSSPDVSGHAWNDCGVSASRPVRARVHGGPWAGNTLGLDERARHSLGASRTSSPVVVEVETKQGDLDLRGADSGLRLLRRRQYRAGGPPPRRSDGRKVNHPRRASRRIHRRVCPRWRRSIGHRAGVAACDERWSGRAAIGEDRGPPAVCTRSASDGTVRCGAFTLSLRCTVVPRAIGCGALGAARSQCRRDQPV